MAGGKSLASRKWKYDGFNLGVNTFALPTEVKTTELSNMINGELYGKRSVRPRRGSLQLGDSIANYKIDGLIPYKDRANSYNKLLAIINGDAYEYNTSTEDWENEDSAVFTAGYRVRYTQLQGYSYLGNGVDGFTRYKPGTFFETFTAVAAPTGLAVTPQGTTGTEKYSYEITTVTSKGESLPCTAVEITNGNSILDSTNKNQIQFTRRTETQVIGYNVYGRSTTGNGRTLLVYINQPASGTNVTFIDDGSLDPSVWPPTIGDSTDGVTVKQWEQLRGSLVGIGDPASPHRLYFSGTGDKYESFSPAHNGGWVDIRPGDNDDGCKGLAPFESKIIVGKQNSIGQFYFSPTTGDALYAEIITYVGVGSMGSMVVMENDIAFIDTERRLRILGYEPNFQAAIRTTSLSEGRTQSLFNQINPAYIDNCEAVYFNGRYLLAYTPTGQTKNTEVLVYDRKYLSFLGTWKGQDCHINCWAVWDGVGNQKKLYAGSSDADGKIWEFNVEGYLTAHDNTAIETIINFRTEDLDDSAQEKIWKWADYRLYRVYGEITIKTVFNGTEVDLERKRFSSETLVGWGVVKWGTKKWGEATGAGSTESTLDRTYRKELYQNGNSLTHEVSKNSVNADFVLVSIAGEAMPLPTEVFDSNNLI